MPTDDLVIERFCDGHIVAFKILDMTPVAVDQWVDACRNEMETCVKEERPLLILQDLSESAAQQTAYSKVRGRELTTAYPELRGRVAFVLSKTLSTYRVRHFVKGQELEARERQIFLTREEAIEWLKEFLPEPS
jgi:hypothetical protein